MRTYHSRRNCEYIIMQPFCRTQLFADDFLTDVWLALMVYVHLLYHLKPSRNLTLSLLQHTHPPYWHRWWNIKFTKTSFLTLMYGHSILRNSFLSLYFYFSFFLLVYFFTPLIGVMLHRVGLHTRSTAIGLLFTSVTAACQITITFWLSASRWYAYHCNY